MGTSHRPERERQALARKSKKLSWLLRHGAREMGLAMDSAGFANIGEVLRMTGLTRDELDQVVAENNKSRFEVRGKQVRAVQGHSLGVDVLLVISPPGLRAARLPRAQRGAARARHSR